MRKTDFAQLVLLAFLVNILCQAAHESGHLLVYQVYGHNPTWGFIGLVQRWDEPPLHPENWLEVNDYGGQTGWLRLKSQPDGGLEEVIAAAAGPLASALSAFLALVFSRRKNNPALRLFAQMFALSMSLGMTFYSCEAPGGPMAMNMILPSNWGFINRRSTWPLGWFLPPACSLP
jgi:hypothetical protein